MRSIRRGTLDDDPPPAQCAHYRCTRTDVGPECLRVLGQDVMRLVCPDHALRARGRTRAVPIDP